MSELSKVITCGRDSSFDSPHFSAVEFVNQRFPTGKYYRKEIVTTEARHNVIFLLLISLEESLMDIDEVLAKLNSELSELNSQVTCAVKEHSIAMFHLQKDLEHLQTVGEVSEDEIDCTKGISPVYVLAVS